MSTPKPNPQRPNRKILAAWLRTRTPYLLVLIFSVLLCIGGIVYAVKVSGKDVDAGRGGALADVAALIVLFLGRGYGSRIYEILTAPPDEEEALAKDYAPMLNANRADVLYGCMKVDAQETHWQNRYLAFITVLGTLTWGFGDRIADIFLPGH
jgi:hypothetical protein